jgi:hypothetical protein
MEPKICKIHGLLSEDQYSIDLKPNGKTTRRCKLCKKEGRERFLAKLKENKTCTIHGKLIPELIKPDGRCRLCHRKNASKKRNENRAWFNAKMAIDREKNPEKWKEIYKKEYLKQRKKHKEFYSLNKCCEARGITIEQYQKIYEQQKGTCAICFQKETRIDSRTKSPMRLTIDHVHDKTKKVRGLLCHACNVSIGLQEDDPKRMRRAADYVEQGGFIESKGVQ